MPTDKYIAEHGMHPAEILQLLRDGKAEYLHDLYDLANEKWGDESPVSMPLRIVRSCVAVLVDAKLIEVHSVPEDEVSFDGDERKSDRYTVAPHLDAIQSALGFSLSELASTATDTPVRVRPFFGHPNALEECPDVFVLMPFARDMRPVYEDHISSAAMRAGVSVGRADDFFTHGSVVQDIWNALCNCKIVVADCTGRNPNVFYEIGIAHTIGVPTILVTQTIEDVPFDLRHIRCLTYDFTPRGMKLFEDQLYKTLVSSLERKSNTLQTSAG